MADSFVHPQTCGFAKVVAYSVFTNQPNITKEVNEGNAKFKARILQEQHAQFRRVFVDRSDAFRIDYRQFQRSLQTLKQIFSRWGRDKAGEKQRYTSTFSATNWTKLSVAKKEQHTFSKCKGCFRSFTEIQGMFPVKSPKF